MKNFTGAELSSFHYEGNAGRKTGIVFDNNFYLLKYPKNTKDMRRMERSYTTSPISEYVGSKIYELLEIPTHETILGIDNNKVVVACKDFRFKNKEFVGMFDSFSGIINNVNDEVFDHYTNSQDSSLDYCIDNINANSKLNKIGLNKVHERFWTMFFIDAFINNNDRNNGNWGVIATAKSIELAPVFDNGNSFNNKFSDNQMMNRLDKLFDLQCKNIQSVYKDKNKNNIKPYEFLLNHDIKELHEVITTITPKINLDKINKMIYDIPSDYNNLPVCSDIQKDFMIKSLAERYKNMILPAYNRSRDVIYQNQENIKIPNIEDIIKRTKNEISLQSGDIGFKSPKRTHEDKEL